MTIPISQQYSLLLRLKQKRSNLEKKVSQVQDFAYARKQ